LLLALALSAAAWAGARAVTDASGARVALAEPARRIVSLAPHATELLFAAGAGAYVVGAVEYSDYPPAARDIPRVGRHESLDLEAIVELRPDLVVAWASGNPAHQVARLRTLGIPVYLSEPRRLEDIPATLERLGMLTATEAPAQEAARAFRAGLQALRERYSGQRRVTVFYQVWHRPLVTVSGGQIISEVIGLCGGVNVFADLPELAPQIGIEAVLGADPEIIVASGAGEERPPWLEDWRRWTHLQAVERDLLVFVAPDLIQRATPRILEGARALCELIERARMP
jgi:iron complex transport system substrate-binding protein